jgi:hypothetical protein
MRGKLLTGLVVVLMALGVCLALLPSTACNSSSSSATDPGDESHSQEAVQTIGATVTCDPQFNTLPATVNICVDIINLVDSPRTVDGRIDVWLGNGDPLYEWRFRAIKLPPNGTWDRCWNNEMTDLQTLKDKNIVRLHVVDVTPPPFNQPPYPPSGYVVEDVCFFWGINP